MKLENFSIDQFSIEDGRMKIRFSGKELPELAAPSICLVQKSSNISWKTSVSIDMEEKEIVVDLKDFLSEYFRPAATKWGVQLQGTLQGESVIYTMKVKAKPVNKIKGKGNDLRKQYFNIFVKKEMEGIVWAGRPYYTNTQELCIEVLPYSQLYKAQLEGEVHQVQITGSKLHVQGEIKDLGFLPKYMYLKYRSKDIHKKELILFPINIRKENQKIFFEGICELQEKRLKQFFWDIGLMVEKEGDEFELNLINQDNKFEVRSRTLFYKNEYKTSDGFIVYPYITVDRTYTLYFRKVEKHDNFIFKVKERIAFYLGKLLKEKLKKKNILLVYEKYSIAAQENGFYFFRYCMEHQGEELLNKSVYYVIDKKSPDYQNVKEYGDKVVPFLSIRHMLYVMYAKLLVSSEVRGHVYAWRGRDSLINEKLMTIPMVFLQHGVLGLKKVPIMSKRNGKNRMSLFITSSEMEKGFATNYLAYGEDEVAVTGLARWDALEDTSKELGKREILLMPTWREELDEVEEEEFIESQYFKTYQEVLNSEKIHKLLEENQLTLQFYIHPKLRAYIDRFQSNHSNVRINSFGEVPLNQLIMQSSMMITDYSSAVWDAYYLKKPVLFFQFDFDSYTKKVGSYMDMKTELFGDVAYTKEQLENKLEEVIQSGFQEKPEYEKLREKYIPHIDKENSKRICEAIVKRGI